MKAALVLLAVLVPAAFADGPAGTWTATLPGGEEIGFDLDAKGSELTGMAFLGRWGVADLSGGKIDGDHFSFTVARMTASPPKLAFEGTVVGKQMKLTMSEPGQEARPLSVRKVESMVVAPVSVDATAADLTGAWKAWFVGRIGDRPKMFSEIVFDFKVEGAMLTGNAHMGAWPGDADISEGHFEAGHFSFTATGRVPSSSGIPKFRFQGTIHGKEMKLAMEYDSSLKELPMDARKLQ